MSTSLAILFRKRFAKLTFFLFIYSNLLILPSIVSGDDCPIELVAHSTLDTIYLMSNRDIPLLTTGTDIQQTVHDWIKHPINNINNFENLNPELFDKLFFSAFWPEVDSPIDFRVCNVDYVFQTESPTSTATPNNAIEVNANPFNIMDAIDQINDAPVEEFKILNLQEGVYNIGDITIETNNLKIVAGTDQKPIFNGEWTDSITFSRVEGTDVYVALDNLPNPIHQVHVDIFSRTERLPAFRNVKRSPSEHPTPAYGWRLSTLDLSDTGGWYVSNERLFLKMPNGQNPNNLVHITGEYENLFDIIGNNIWIEGLEVIHYGLHDTNNIGNTTVNFDEYSGIRFSGRNIVVKDNVFRFNRSHALIFEDSERIQVENNRFVDNQNFMTYRQARTDSRVCIKDPVSAECIYDGDISNPHFIQRESHKASNRVLYNRSNTISHRKNLHSYNLQAVILAGVQFADVIDNRFEYTRNKPVEIRDGVPSPSRMPNESIKDVKKRTQGYSITIAKNIYSHVGWSLPSNEGNAFTGPVWWINNCVNQYGWPGNTTYGDTIRQVQANRYGGGLQVEELGPDGILQEDEKPQLGVQLVYHNVIASNQVHESFSDYSGWVMPGNKRFLPGSKFLNNVWQVPDTLPADKPSSAWNPNSSNGPFGVGRDMNNANDILFDHNQYWKTSGYPNAFFGGLWTLEQMQNNITTQVSAGEAIGQFEPNGKFSDPKIVGCHISNPIPPKNISGVTGNIFLFDQTDSF